MRLSAGTWASDRQMLEMPIVGRTVGAGNVHLHGADDDTVGKSDVAQLQGAEQHRRAAPRGGHGRHAAVPVIRGRCPASRCRSIAHDRRPFPAVSGARVMVGLAPSCRPDDMPFYAHRRRVQAGARVPRTPARRAGSASESGSQRVNCLRPAVPPPGRRCR